MKIKITNYVPVEENFRPTIGEVYEVIHFKWHSDRMRLFFIEVNGTEVGIYEGQECEVASK